MRNRIIILTLVASLITVGSAFAAGTATGWQSADGAGNYAMPVTNSITPFSLKLSANVKVNYIYDSTAAPDGGKFYVIGTAHSSGNKTYASSSTDSRLYMYVNTDQTQPAAPVSPADDGSTDFGSWTVVK